MVYMPTASYHYLNDFAELRSTDVKTFPIDYSLTDTYRHSYSVFL